MNTTTPSPTPDPVPPTPEPTAPAAAPPPLAVDDSRPFGAHLRMRWWKPLLLVPALVILMLVLQIVLTVLVVTVEVMAFGRDPMDLTMSPLMMLATNLSLAVMGPIAVLATALLARVPWRSLLASPRRLSLRRWGVYLGGSTALVAIATVLAALVAPQSVGMAGFAVTGTTIGLLVVAVLTTPLQAAGEELMFRGAVMPALASWVRAARPALILGMILSSLIFGAMHASLDPWLLAYYVAFGLCMAAMAVISRGLEAPIAFHVTNNLLMMIAAALFADGGGILIDRSVGMGGPYMLLFIAMDLAAVALVWLHERRLRASHHPSASSAARSLSA